MITASRRQLLGATGLLALGGAIPAGCSRAVGEGGALAVGKPNLFIGTGGHGHTFPGASLPFGMAQLSPDTNTHGWDACRSEEHTSELQSLMRISYAVFCL